LLRIGSLEYLRSLGDQFDELAAELHASAFGVLVPGQVPAQQTPLFLELVPSLSEEVFRDEPAKAIVIEPVHEELLLLDLRADFLDDRLVVGARTIGRASIDGNSLVNTEGLPESSSGFN
jgi:hypothetical protein